MRSVLKSPVVWVLATEVDRLFQYGIVRGKNEFFRASLYCMSGIYNIEHYVMTW